MGDSDEQFEPDWVSSGTPDALNARLAVLIEDARRLGQALSRCDERSFRTWRERQDQWQKECMRVLGFAFAQETVREFLKANTQATQVTSFEQLLAGEMRAMSDAIELLQSLRMSIDERYRMRRDK